MIQFPKFHAELLLNCRPRQPDLLKVCSLLSSDIVSVEIQRPSVMLLQGCSIEHSLLGILFELNFNEKAICRFDLMYFFFFLLLQIMCYFDFLKWENRVTLLT